MDVREQADELVSIIENNAGEPDAIARAIAPIYRKAEAEKNECEEVSVVHDKGRVQPVGGAQLGTSRNTSRPSSRGVSRRRRPLRTSPLGSQSINRTEPEAEVVHGASVLVMGSGGAQLFRFDLADTERR